MKKAILFLIGTLVLSAGLEHLLAQNPGPLTSTTYIRKSYTSEKITVDNTAGGKGFTSSAINPTCTDCDPSTSRASAAVCTLETADIRIQTSGVAVTSSTGIYVISGQSFVVYGYADILAFKAIRVTATSGVINCTYYR